MDGRITGEDRLVMLVILAIAVVAAAVIVVCAWVR
jgi:hypothetical protein